MLREFVDSREPFTDWEEFAQWQDRCEFRNKLLQNMDSLLPCFAVSVNGKLVKPFTNTDETDDTIEPVSSSQPFGVDKLRELYEQCEPNEISPLDSHPLCQDLADVLARLILRQEKRSLSVSEYDLRRNDEFDD